MCVFLFWSLQRLRVCWCKTDDLFQMASFDSIYHPMLLLPLLWLYTTSLHVNKSVLRTSTPFPRSNVYLHDVFLGRCLVLAWQMLVTCCTDAWQSLARMCYRSQFDGEDGYLTYKLIAKHPFEDPVKISNWSMFCKWSIYYCQACTKHLSISTRYIHVEIDRIKW